MGWLPKQKVVVPVDFSDQSIAAVRTALEFVPRGANIYVIHVLPSLAPGEPGMIWDDSGNEARCEHARMALHDRLNTPDLTGVHLEARIGDPSQQIADFAQELHADLVIMPSHGRTGISRF